MLAPSFVLTKANNGSRHGDQYLNINDLTLIFLSGEEKRGYESVMSVCVHGQRNSQKLYKPS